MKRSLVVVALAACAGELPERHDPPISQEEAGLDTIFERAAEEARVPVDLLKAIGYVETRWHRADGAEEFEGRPAAHGLMALRGEQLDDAAAAAGLSPDDVRVDDEANLRAAAALLRDYADQLGIDGPDLGAWAPAVAAFGGLEGVEAQSSYVDEVYRVLRDGVTVTLEGDVVVGRIPATPVEPDFPRVGVSAAGGTVDYPGAIWRASPNYNARPSGSIGDVGMVIIHTCEGGYSGCWSWLTNTASSASAHYVVNATGSEISQLVRESNRAWHISATYACSRNSSVECWRNGYSSNHFTVGIEHAGFGSQASWPDGQIDASARLVCDITRDHGIPRDRYHIVGHGQLQPWNRTDPGPNWPWSDYVERIRSHCGDGGGGGSSTPSSLIVDSNNTLNDTSKGYLEVSSSWTASNATSGYYGSGYYWAGTQAISDGAKFQFHMPSAGPKTIDAWWTAGSNRSSATPFVVIGSNGVVLGKVFRDQRANGSQWNELGTWNFPAGWNQIVVSRWAAEGSVVVADAIRVR